MTDLTDERLAEIRALAEAATPGVWFTDHAREVCAMLGGISPVLIAETGTSGELVVEQSEADAAFIALGPKTTLALLDALTSARERAERAEAERDEARQGERGTPQGRAHLAELDARLPGAPGAPRARVFTTT